MPHRILLVLLLAATLLAAACGSPGGESGAGGGGDAGAGPDTPVTSSPRPRDPMPNSGGPMRVEPRDGLVDVRPVRFEKAEIKDENTVEIQFFDGVEECYGVDRVEVGYAPEEITVTLFPGREPEAEMCIELAVLKSVEVALDEPLDGRKIVDGAKKLGAG
ncbi:MAG: hypothetical protein ACRDKZ_06660 [Actinomycetota bacterium]